MTLNNRVSVGWPVLVAGSLALLAVGAGAGYLALRPGPAHTQATAPVAASEPLRPAQPPSVSTAAPMATPGNLPDVVVTLGSDAVARAGITVTPVAVGTSSAALRIPGVVEPNTYKVVAVTPLVSGRISHVSADLGQQVRRGQTIAQIYSPELAEAETRYIAIEAELAAHDRELVRTSRLVEIGAASKQELERVHAEHTARRADRQAAASRLLLLGRTREAIDELAPGSTLSATIRVPAPIAGVITERMANVGLNVDPSSKLFTVLDLSTVWVVAEVYEKDFGRVSVGSAATVTTTAYPGVVLRGRVSYIDPQLSAATRTAKVRIEVPNADGRLRLGMYAEATIEGARQAQTPMIPRSAVQHVADRTFVYLVDPKKAHTFTEREVRLGTPSGDRVSVLDGVAAGEVVVAEGSFHVRAERERLGLREALPPPAPPPSAPTPSPSPTPQAARITVDDQGYHPARVALRAGVPARLTFVRTSATTCGTEVVFPSLNLKRTLPLNEPVVLEFTPRLAGDVAFTCGLAMFKGSAIVQ